MSDFQGEIVPYIYIYPIVFQILSHNIPLLHQFSYGLPSGLQLPIRSEENALHLHMQLHHSVDVLKQAAARHVAAIINKNQWGCREMWENHTKMGLIIGCCGIFDIYMYIYIYIMEVQWVYYGFQYGLLWDAHGIIL